MVENWAHMTADRIASEGPLHKGRLLLLGAADTGKTTLLNALADRLAQTRPVALVDADVGQSHIGPPTTVGWALRERHGVRRAVLSVSARSMEMVGTAHPTEEARGIAFVGDVTPVGHLLQLTAAVALCVEQAEQAADMVLIDTPGLVTGGAACALWWTVQRLLRPRRIIAIQRENELEQVLRGLQTGVSSIEPVKAPAVLRRKSPEARQQHRRRLFDQYFHKAAVYTLDLDRLALRETQRMTADNSIGRVISLADRTGRDIAIGVIERWRQKKAETTIRAPRLDIRRVRCLTIGAVRVDTPFGWS
jgi:polynucleotide 5'-hydroxyl-kinase GRC3/NOL9